MNTINFKLDSDEKLVYQFKSNEGIHPYVKYFLFVFPIFAILLGIPALYFSITADDKIIINRPLTKEEILKDSLDFIKQNEEEGLDITPGIGLEFSIQHDTEKVLVYPNYRYLLRKESVINIIENTPWRIGFLYVLTFVSFFVPVIYYVVNKQSEYQYILTDKRLIEVDKKIVTSYYWNIFIPEVKLISNNTISLFLKMCYYKRFRGNNQRSHYLEPYHIFYKKQEEVKNILEKYILKDKNT